MGNKGRWEYLRGIYERYQKAGRKTKKMNLDEFCENLGYYRKYAHACSVGRHPKAAASYFYLSNNVSGRAV